MKSVLIEYFRSDNLDVGVLASGKRYILTHKDLAVKEVETKTEHLDLLRKMREFFRYQKEKSEEEKWNAIKEISAQVKLVFLPLDDYGYSNCNLDVVLNAAELGLIPFELLLDDNGKPYFADPEKNIVFTRRLRESFGGVKVPLPVEPRVLFVYCHGGFNEVPYKEHQYEIERSLDKWILRNEDKGRYFTMLENPSFETFSGELKLNDNERSKYTHVHVLAHGNLIFDPLSPEEFEYGIVFGTDKNKPTAANEVKNLFQSLVNKPSLVNYMICDGANFSNAMKPDKNPVQVTHKMGVPVVLGSQYPLSMQGSTLITRMLYAGLFAGEDIREILGNIRRKLFKSREQAHDWISFVSYVRLPDDYQEYLNRVSLVWQMQQLKSIRNATDALLQQPKFSADDFIYNIARLKESIDLLTKKLNEIQGDPRYEKECLENLGLLGSTYKRLSELKFVLSEKKGSRMDAEQNEQRSLLSTAAEYYKKACDINLSHHWSTVQFLSLRLLLDGSITGLMDYWIAARRAIITAMERDATDPWPYGSMLELLLLHDDRSEARLAEIDNSSEKLVAISRSQKDNYAVVTSLRQLRRYMDWFVPVNGFVIRDTYLVADKKIMTGLISKLERVGNRESGVGSREC